MVETLSKSELSPPFSGRFENRQGHTDKMLQPYYNQIEKEIKTKLKPISNEIHTDAAAPGAAASATSFVLRPFLRWLQHFVRAQM